ncbi:hypothetical protein [Vibrio mediterranei]|uniref:Uncharacterized protein n=1 Tax=Vibrio mediterranei TaxID=689 RepID=A0AAN1KNZ0_9VIBR|nr:hypothetical protein [Vibrio mediterranei]ASI90958.1 hypothetical protein BSZ05_14800 [Vibrio mediterranei]
MNFNLIQGQVMPLTVESSWLFIESYHGKLSVRIDSTGEEFTLPSGSVLRYGKPLGRILLSGQGALSIEHGTGDFTPPIEGQKLDIQTMPQVELLPGQSMKVSELPKVKIESGQSVGVSSMPKMKIDNGQSIEVSALPAVQLAANQSLSITSLPKVRIEAGQAIRVQAGSTLTAHSGELPLDIPANANRKGVIIKAPSSNTGLVSLNGFELVAGEKLTIESAAAFTLTGSAPDKAQVLEY